MKFGVFLDLIKTAGPPWSSLERPEKEDKTGDGKAETKQDRLYVGNPCVSLCFPTFKKGRRNLIIPSHYYTENVLRKSCKKGWFSDWHWMFICVGNLAALKGVIGRQDGKRRCLFTLRS